MKKTIRVVVFFVLLFFFIRCNTSKQDHQTIPSENGIEVIVGKAASDKADYARLEIFIKDKIKKAEIDRTSTICINDICYQCDSTGKAIVYLLKGKFEFKARAVGYEDKVLKKCQIVPINEYKLKFFLSLKNATLE
jgi:hypothetical protein